MIINACWPTPWESVAGKECAVAGGLSQNTDTNLTQGSAASLFESENCCINERRNHPHVPSVTICDKVRSPQ